MAAISLGCHHFRAFPPVHIHFVPERPVSKHATRIDSHLCGAPTDGTLRRAAFDRRLVGARSLCQRKILASSPAPCMCMPHGLNSGLAASTAAKYCLRAHVCIGWRRTKHGTGLAGQRLCSLTCSETNHHQEHDLSGDLWSFGCGRAKDRRLIDDAKRTLTSILVGLFYFGPALHYWLQMITAAIPGFGPKGGLLLP